MNKFMAQIFILLALYATPALAATQIDTFPQTKTEELFTPSEKDIPDFPIAEHKKPSPNTEKPNREGWKVIEIWECRKARGSPPVKVKRVIAGEKEYGEIEASGIKYETDFRIDGFNRIWKFGKLLKSGWHEHYFKINIDHRGSFSFRDDYRCVRDR